MKSSMFLHTCHCRGSQSATLWLPLLFSTCHSWSMWLSLVTALLEAPLFFVEAENLLSSSYINTLLYSCSKVSHCASFKKHATSPTFIAHIFTNFLMSGVFFVLDDKLLNLFTYTRNYSTPSNISLSAQSLLESPLTQNELWTTWQAFPVNWSIQAGNCWTIASQLRNAGNCYNFIIIFVAIVSHSI